MKNDIALTDGSKYFDSQKKKSRLKFIFLFSTFLSLFFLRDIIGITISPLYFLLTSTLLFVCFDEAETTAFLLILPLLNTGFQYSYAIGLGLIIFIIKNIKKLSTSICIIPFFFLFIWEFLHILIPPFSIYDYLKSMIPFLVWTFFIAINGIKFQTKLVIRSFIAVLLFVLICILLITLKSFNFSMSAMWAKGFRLGFETTEVNYILRGNPNDLGFYCNLAIASILLLISKERQKKQKIFLYIILFVLTVFGLSTMSRAFIVVFVFIIFYFFWISSKKNIRNKIMNILLAMSIMVFLVFLIYIVFPELFRSVISRFLVEDISSGRNTIFAGYTTFIFSGFDKFLFGIGVQNIFIKVTRMSPVIISNVSHNGIQEIFVVWGFVGFIIIIFLFICYFFSAKNKGAKITAQSILPFLVAFIKIQSGQFVSAPVTLIMFMYAYVCLFEINSKERSQLYNVSKINKSD